jgi:CheY-specific phosphatase CheX
MTTTLTQIDEIEQMTRDAVRLVFQTMLSMDVADVPEVALTKPNIEVFSSVGFIGEVTGSVYLGVDTLLSHIITARMLGISQDEIESDEMVNDVMGEVSNMIVGQVKSRLCDSGSTCTLTIPSIVRGKLLSVEPPAHVTKRLSGFNYGNKAFFTEILVKDNEA